MRASRRARLAALALLGALAVSAARADAPPRTLETTIGGQRFVLEVAVDLMTQYRGLGGRTRIDPHGGMLFVYPSPRPLAFVMRDCPIPIDIAFLDGTGRVINVHTMQPEPPRRAGEPSGDYESRLPPYPSALPAQYAVELAGGRLRELGVRPGDTIDLGGLRRP